MFWFYSAGLGLGKLFVKKITQSLGEKLNSAFNEANPNWAMARAEGEIAWDDASTGKQSHHVY